MHMLCRVLLCLGIVELCEDNVDSVAVRATAKLLLTPRMANSSGLHSIILQHLLLQLFDRARLSHHHVVAALEVACGTQRHECRLLTFQVDAAAVFCAQDTSSDLATRKRSSAQRTDLGSLQAWLASHNLPGTQDRAKSHKSVHAPAKRGQER